MQPSNPLLGQPQPGDVILGKYKVERVIGLGGMGAVVSARHLQLEERVAIKFLLPAMLSNEEVVQRFLREAKAAIRIRSEHCVRVLDVGTLETGAPYMVMEYLEGQDLAAIAETNAVLPIADVIDWVLQAGEALAEAHALGIVHRDLKPANLFLTRRADGTPSVKVLDFGISKQATSGIDAGVTKTQAVLGSPRYMSPEQMRSTKDVDARADVWALGAVVHELVSGRPPFDAETMTALCAAILQDPPRSMLATRPYAPPQLEAAVRGALEKDRDRRFANVAQLAAALAPFGSHTSRASAERIARVLGVPTGVTFASTGPGYFGGSSPGFAPAPPMAATTNMGFPSASKARRSAPASSQPTWRCRPTPSSPQPTAPSTPIRTSPAKTGKPTRPPPKPRSRRRPPSPRWEPSRADAPEGAGPKGSRPPSLPRHLAAPNSACPSPAVLHPHTRPINSACSSSNPRADTLQRFFHPPSAPSSAQPNSGRPPPARPDG